MIAVGPIANVEARIGGIRQRIAPSSSTLSSTVLEEFAPGDPGATFDPFGSAYQAAVDGVAMGTVAPVSAARTQRYGSPSLVASMVTMPASSFVATGVPGASLGRIGGYGPMPVPEDLAVYGNGNIPPGVLQPVGQGGHLLWGPAADSWKSAVAAAAVDGIELRVTDSYRSYGDQVDLVDRKGLYSNGGYGAVPGTSNHGWGLAIDIDVTSPSTMAWVRANAYRFGFVEAVPREPWHWEFRPQQA